MASVTGKALRKTWQVTEKANPFMTTSGKATQTRTIVDKVCIGDECHATESKGFRYFIAKFKFMREPAESKNWTLWEQNLRDNISCLVREEEKRQSAFRRMMHRIW